MKLFPDLAEPNQKKEVKVHDVWGLWIETCGGISGGVGRPVSYRHKEMVNIGARYRCRNGVKHNMPFAA